MDMIGRIRRLHGRGKKSVREIARTTGLSRNTVAKWLRGSIEGEPRYRRGAQPTKLDAFHEALRQALKADAHRPRRDRRSARALFNEIRAAGYGGGYTRVKDFVRAWRLEEGRAAASRAFVPLAFEMGEAFQFDWSEEGLVVGGIYYQAQVAHMKLCASRAFWLVAYPSQGHEMLFDAHTRAFAALGGVARRGIYDNMKTAVDKVKKGKGRRRERAVCRDVRALPVRPRLLQRRLRLGERRRREERAGQSAADLDRGRPSGALAPLPRSTPGWRPVPGSVERDPPPGARAVQRGRDARARAFAADADVGAVRWLRREDRRGCRAPAWCRWRATATRCRASWLGTW